MRQTLKKNGLLRGKKNFQLLFEKGRKFDGIHLRCLLLSGPDLQQSGNVPVRFGVAVSRSVRRAVDRNRVKRLVRESYRKNKEIVISRATALSRPISLVFLFIPNVRSAGRAAIPPYCEIEQDVQALLKTVAQKELS